MYWIGKEFLFLLFIIVEDLVVMFMKVNKKFFVFLLLNVGIKFFIFFSLVFVYEVFMYIIVDGVVLFLFGFGVRKVMVVVDLLLVIIGFLCLDVLL